ncbi:hypothetical protein BX600DRAFT_471735 [Xylariales sp. PMI_506]|nr:hypothetical protein BX600DRAFT_471735 [Xylariales sp. PMI_506]
MTSIFQLAVIIESILNFAGAYFFIFHSEWCLSFVLSPTAAAAAAAAASNTATAVTIADVPPSTALLLQTYGVLVFALTIPLLLAYSDAGEGEDGGASAVFYRRDIVFKTLAAGEAGLILLLRFRAAAPQPTGFTEAAGFLTPLGLVPALAWHTYVFLVSPGLMQPAALRRSAASTLINVRKKGQ